MTISFFSTVQSYLTFSHSNFLIQYTVQQCGRSTSPLLKENLTRLSSFPLVNFCHKNQNVCHLYDHSTYHSLSYKFPSPCALLSLWNQCAQLLSLNTAPLSSKAEQNQQMRSTTVTIRALKNTMHRMDCLESRQKLKKRMIFMAYHFETLIFQPGTLILQGKASSANVHHNRNN